MTKMTATPMYGINPFRNILLQNQKVDDTGTWYVALGIWGLPTFSNDDPSFTSTYLTPRSTLLLLVLKWDFLLKVDLLKTVETKALLDIVNLIKQ